MRQVRRTRALCSLRDWYGRPSRFALAAFVCIAGCGGGGGGGGSDPLQPQLGLHVSLTAWGTMVTCDAPRPTQAQLTRSHDRQSFAQEISCPSRTALADDFRLSSWEVAPLPLSESNGRLAGAATATTALPAPVVLRDGDRVMLLDSGGLSRIDGQPVVVQRILDSGEVEETAASMSGGLAESIAATRADRWRWKATRDGVDFLSESVAPRVFTVHDGGQWGALAVADPLQDGHPVLIGLPTYAAAGLGAFASARDFRDIRHADLDNDGREDIVSNVYGDGCTLIAMARSTGDHDIITPLRGDGSCIGGHGETLLVADFDGNGRVDIFLPSYERFDLLLNLGDGRFVEAALPAGITFPNYRPQVEGAAAVDIDGNGTIDIVVASEVLLNDGKAHFTPVDRPFGPTRIVDEGMSVADLDGDGRFDIVKSDPSLGPRIFWGTAQPTVFDDAGWVLGGQQVSARAYGLAVGDLMGNGRPTLVLAGGASIGAAPGVGNSPPPRVCIQPMPRQFTCLTELLPGKPGAWQDLLLVTDMNNDGYDDLVARYASQIVYGAPTGADAMFRFDLRDAQGLRNQYGRRLRVTCASDDSLVGLKFVDGGNGYMAQGNYVVSFLSDWCASVLLRVPGAHGSVTYGPFGPGLHRVTVS